MVGRQVPDVVADGLEGVGIFLQSFTLCGKTLRQGFHEQPVPAGNPEGFSVENDLLAEIQPFPGKVHQAEALEQPLQGFAGAEAAHVMESGVEAPASADERLQAAARLPSFLQDGHAIAAAGQEQSAFQAAEAGSDDDGLRHSGSRGWNSSRRSRRSWKGTCQTAARWFPPMKPLFIIRME